MLPVSGAEQLNTSGAIGDAAHDLAQRRVFEVGQAGAVLVSGRNRFHSPAARALGFSSSMIGTRLPAVACGDLLVVELLVGIDVLVHERRELLLKFLDLWGMREVHSRIVT